jgi:hypothetical protein
VQSENTSRVKYDLKGRAEDIQDTGNENAIYGYIHTPHQIKDGGGYNFRGKYTMHYLIGYNSGVTLITYIHPFNRDMELQSRKMHVFKAL